MAEVLDTALVNAAYKHKFSFGATTVTTSTNAGQIIRTNGLRFIAFQVKNTGGSNALTQFALLGRAHPDADFETLVDSGTTPTWSVDAVLNTLGTGVSLTASVDISAMEAVRFQASSTTTTITIMGSLQG